MLGAYVEGKQQVTASFVRKGAQEVLGEKTLSKMALPVDRGRRRRRAFT